MANDCWIFQKDTCRVPPRRSAHNIDNAMKIADENTSNISDECGNVKSSMSPPLLSFLFMGHQLLVLLFIDKQLVNLLFIHQRLLVLLIQHRLLLFVFQQLLSSVFIQERLLSVVIYSQTAVHLLTTTGSINLPTTSSICLLTSADDYSTTAEPCIHPRTTSERYYLSTNLCSSFYSSTNDYWFY